MHVTAHGHGGNETTPHTLKVIVIPTVRVHAWAASEHWTDVLAVPGSAKLMKNEVSGWHKCAHTLCYPLKL